MNYITTNIRLSEEDYLRLKEEAAKKRKSFAAIVREKIGSVPTKRSPAEIAQIKQRLENLAKKNAQKTKGFDVVKALREMRYEGKW